MFYLYKAVIKKIPKDTHITHNRSNYLPFIPKLANQLSYKCFIGWRQHSLGIQVILNVLQTTTTTKQTVNVIVFLSLKKLHDF